jgi:predicted transcriptional regulator
MKILLCLFLLILIANLPVAYSQISYYGIENEISKDSSVNVKMTITFSEAIKEFNFILFYKIANFKAFSNAGPVDCSVEYSSITNVQCKLQLTSEKRSLEITFTTSELVKGLNNKLFLFNGDFGLNKDISSMFVSVKIPEGMVLTSKNNTYPTLPQKTNILSDGRRIIVTWSLSNITSDTPLKFQLAYEPSTSVVTDISGYWLYFLIGVTIATIASLIFIKKFRKPKDVILSVLDDYEKLVMDCIVKAGGTINQKKIVQETNLSKAKVSRVIKNLVERGLVESERLGRTNKIKLVKKKFGYF